MQQLVVFFYLQFLDALTTLIGLRMGLREVNPTIEWLMRIGPEAGLLACKIGALFLLGLCYWLKRPRVIGWVNYVFGVIVAWNAVIIFLAMRALS